MLKNDTLPTLFPDKMRKAATSLFAYHAAKFEVATRFRAIVSMGKAVHNDIICLTVAFGIERALQQ